MGWLHARTLVESPRLLVGDVRCRAPRSAAGAPEHTSIAQIVLPRRGVFDVHRGRRLVAADPTTAFVLREGDDYRVSHPLPGGDDCTVFVLADAGDAEELLHGAAHAAMVPPQVQLAARALVARVSRGSDAEDLAKEEAAAGIVVALSGVLRRASAPQGRATPFQERRVADVRALVASAPAARWSLHGLASAFHCSPFHLARQFRAVSGESVARYVTRLRLSLALERIAGGETDLGRLGCELGFASHSHFTARFRRCFGATPSEVRERLRGSSVRSAHEPDSGAAGEPLSSW